MRKLLKFVTAVTLAVFCSGATAVNWVIEQLYTNADASVQFVVFVNLDWGDWGSGRPDISGDWLTATGPDGEGPLMFTFPHDLPGDGTDRRFLVATQRFADLHYVQPDYIVPNGFFEIVGNVFTSFVGGWYGGGQYDYPALPTSGVHGMWVSNPLPDDFGFGWYMSTAVATNFAGEQHVFTEPPPPLPGPPPLRVSKTPDNDTFQPGAQVAFTIVVGNPAAVGAGSATNVTLTDQLPGDGGLVWSNISTSKGSCTIVGNLLSCALGTIAPQSRVTVNVSSAASTPAAACRSQSSIAFATADGGLSAQDAGSLTCPPPPPPPIVTPAPGSTLTSTTVTFTGGHTVNDLQHWLSVETSPRWCDLFCQGLGSAHSATVSGLPTSGTIYVRFGTRFASGWQETDQQYTMNAAASFNYTLASSSGITLTQGAAGSTTITATLQSGSTQAVSLAASGLPSGATAGFGAGSCNPNCSTTLTITTTAATPTGTFPITVTGTPLGRTTAFNLVVNAAAVAPPSIVSPAPGSTLTSTTVTFTGGHTVNDLQHWLDVGTSLGASNLFSQDRGSAHSATVSGLPTSGTIYVRFWTRFASGWQSTDQQYTMNAAAVAPPSIVSPAPGSTLTSTTVTFTGGHTVNDLQHWLDVGTSLGASNLFGQDRGSAHSATVSGLPTSGTIYVRFWTRFASGWQSTDQQYTMNAAAIAPPSIVSPAPGSTLTSTTVTFTGGHTVNDLQHWLDVGTSLGASNLFGQDRGSAHSATVSGLPTSGTIYVRFWTRFASGWQSTDQQYTMNAAASFNYTLASSSGITLTQGAAGSTTITATLQSGSTQAVSLAASGLPSGATAGFGAGSCNPNCSTTLTITTTAATPTGTFPITVTGTPLGRTTAFNLVVNAAAVAPPSIVSPAPGSTLTSTTVTFTGGHTVNDLQHWLDVGTSLGASNLFGQDRGSAHSATVSGLPTSGTIYVRFWTRFASGWQSTDQQYTMNAAAIAPPSIVSPAPGSTLTSTTVTFTGGHTVNDLQHWLDVGTSLGASNLFGQDRGSAHSATVSGLPTSGTIYVRFWTRFASGWQSTDQQYTMNAAASFNYTLASSSGITLTQGAAGSTTITATLQSGSTQAVSLAASGLPSGATAGFGAGSCNPNCSTTLTITTTAATPTGTFLITVTGTPLGRTTAFNLVVNAAAVAPRVWTLTGAQLEDGSVATGYFSYDDATGTVANWNLRLSGGAGPFVAWAIVPGNSYLWSPQPLYVYSFSPSLVPGFVWRSLVITPLVPLDGRSTTVPIDVSSSHDFFEDDFGGVGASREFIAGSLVLTTSPPLVDAHQHGLTGSWYNPATSGQGIQLEVYPNMVAPGTGFLQGSWMTFGYVSPADFAAGAGATCGYWDYGCDYPAPQR